jgi:hypothetical protein
MATLSEFSGADGPLYRYDPELPAHELEIRLFLASERVAKWIEEKLPELKQDLDRELNPVEEFYALMANFCGGTVLEIPRDFHPMRAVGRDGNHQGVWELRTIDLRIFGWFPVKDSFVAVSAHPAKKVKDEGLYHGPVNEVVDFRHRLNLDEPKFISGDDPNAVVSNFDYTS